MRIVDAIVVRIERYLVVGIHAAKDLKRFVSHRLLGRIVAQRRAHGRQRRGRNPARIGSAAQSVRSCARERILRVLIEVRVARLVPSSA